MPAVAGHSAVLAMEKDGDAAGTFTTIARVTSNIPFSWTRPTARSAAHGDTINVAFVGQMETGDITISGDYIHDNGTHDDTNGLAKRHADGDKFGLLFKGPGWTSGNDEVICSGYISSFTIDHPNGADPARFEMTFIPTGVFKHNGTTIGTVAA